jgi:undecaprenyl pyrophosphate phosphatase UppP
MFILQVVILAIVQGLAELLPVSSSAHVVVAEKLMGLDPSSPQMTLLLVMLAAVAGGVFLQRAGVLAIFLDADFGYGDYRCGG